MKIVEINDSQFNNIVLKSCLPVLLECTSPECIICKTMEERILEVSKKHTSDMLFLKLNVNENKRWQDFKVRVIPTLLFFKDGILVSRLDSFPEEYEISKVIESLTKDVCGERGISLELKKSIDSEFVAARFYKHASSNVKNGRAKEKFKLMQQESLVHKDILQARLKELTGELYTPQLTKTDEQNIRPQGFSLFGVLKMAIKIEEKLLSSYKAFKKNKLAGDGGIFSKLIKEESAHLKELQKEMKFASSRDLLDSMDTPDYPTWLNKVFE